MNHSSLLNKLKVNYLVYSHICAKLVRRALKTNFLKAAVERDKSYIKIHVYKDGKKGELIDPLKIKDVVATEDLVHSRAQSSN